MRKHLVSFLKSPIGYVSNFVATCIGYTPWVKNWAWLDYPVCFMCETFCLQDGIQDDVMF